MADKPAKLDAAFLDGKRRQLLKLKEDFRESSVPRRPKKARQGRSNSQAHEYEDDAQKLDTLEKEGNVVRRAVERLAQVQRALSKIDDGTYGFSDVSGLRIPNDRLELMPEAVNTVAEQEASERNA